jgi:uncharacterized protein DUF1236
VKKLYLGCAAGAALLFSAGAVLAQAVIEITPAQERTVYTTLYGQRTTGVAPRDFDVAVGTVLPADVELVEVPATVEIAPVRRYRYVVVGNRVVLVDPTSRRVEKVITP